MTFPTLILLLLPMQPAADSVPNVIKSTELPALADTARQNRTACGPLAVWYALGRLGQSVESESLIASAQVGEHGTSIRRLLELLAEHGHPARAIQTEPNRLSLLPVPAILIVDKGTHCVVFDGLETDGQKAKVFDTTNREIRFVELMRLERAWTGEAIIFDSPRPSTVSLVVMCICATSVIAAPAACLLLRRTRRQKRRDRAGFTLIELLAAIGVVSVLLAVLLPAVQQARESGRATHCRNNLHQIGVGMHNYELHFHTLPPAVVWKPVGEPLGQGIAPPGSIDRISLGLATKEDPDRVHGNWAIALLPFVDQQTLYDAFDLSEPIGSQRNAVARAAELPLMKCPTDPANAADNHFQRAGLAASDEGYARGNYAINGGTNRRCLMRLSRRKLNCTEGYNVDGTDLQHDTSQVWGSGVAGVNRSMRLKEFTCGLSHLVMIEEIRSGLHPLDRRGVWALGFVGSSGTACHGLFGNKGPNRGDDAIQGCSETAAHVDLVLEGMPCLRSSTDPRFEVSERATARSTHVGGVNLLMADGSVHFIDDSIDKRTWHSMHQRDHQEALEF